jgi:hypothetical protein
MTTLTTLAAAARLTSSLAAVAAALASADTEGLLAAEECLSSALADLSRVGSVSTHERASLTRELAHAGAALERCRVLGRSAMDATHTTLVALGRRSADYRRAGEEISAPTEVAARGYGVERSM